jgi:hypothetical protein
MMLYNDFSGKEDQACIRPLMTGDSEVFQQNSVKKNPYKGKT